MCLFGNDLAVAAQYMRALADDLDLIAAGAAPTKAHLAGAPVISRWRPELTDSDDAAVSGIVSSGSFCTASERIQVEIVAADPDLAWIRGLLGWYRLGAPESEFDGRN
jgi:hypothetical protein